MTSSRRSVADVMRRWLVPGTFVAIACSTAAGAVAPLHAAVADPSARHWLLAIYPLLRTAVALAFVAFTIDRPEPHRRAREPLAFAACAVAMLSIGALGGPNSATPAPQLLVGYAVAVGGGVWMLASVLALGRCFGVLPAARGLVRRGPYRFVRHPVYLGEITALVGLVTAAPTTRNLAVLSVFVAAQLVRMTFEERALTAAFPDYAAYIATTGRLFPQLRSRPKAAVASD